MCGPRELVALAALLLALNAAAYGLVRSDKRRAGRGRQRVRERTFHLLGFLLAWPGCVLGFLRARHKTRKPRFLARFALASAAGTAAAGWLALGPLAPC